jgi:hypothetical protein
MSDEIIEDGVEYHVRLETYGYDIRKMPTVVINGVTVGQRCSAVDKAETEIDEIISRRIDTHDGVGLCRPRYRRGGLSVMTDVTSDPLETCQYAPILSAASCGAETVSGPTEAEVWDEDKTGFKHKLILRADSFNPKPLFDSVPSQTWFSGILSPK